MRILIQHPAHTFSRTTPWLRGVVWILANPREISDDFVADGFFCRDRSELGVFGIKCAYVVAFPL